MPLSGTITGSVTNLSTHFSFYVEWVGTQDIAQNCTWITATSYWSTDNTSYAFDTVSKRDASITINGTTASINQRFDCNPWNSNGIYQIQQVSLFRVDHNSDGTKQITISARANGYASSYGPSSSSSASGDCTASATITLDTIPRYATITQALSSKTETSIVINWTADAVCDKLWYSKDNGVSWTAVTISDSQSGTFTLTGLTAYTPYQIKTKVRRKDSQLTSESSALVIATYSYPFADSMPSFTIGSAVTIGIYNPLGRSCTVKMTDSNGTSFASLTTSGTSVKGFNTASAKNAMYASIPNALYGTYKIEVTYSGNTTTKNGGRYNIKESECLPVIGALTYQDRNSTVTALTGNDQDIVQNWSKVRYTATGLSGQKSATLVSCSVQCNGQTVPMTLSGTSAQTPNGSEQIIDSGSDVTATFTLVDSRGLSSTATVSVHMLAYSNPSAIITIERHNNFYSETDFLVDAQFPSINGNNAITISYSCIKDGDLSPSVTGTLSDNVTSTVTLDNNYGWKITITLTDSLGGTTTYNTKVSRGMPILFIDRLRNSVGVNCFPASDDVFEANGILREVTQDNTASVTIPSESGRILRLYRNGAITVTVPDTLPVGYECYLATNFVGARVTLVAGGSTAFLISGQSGLVYSYTVPWGYDYIHLIHFSSNRWIIEMNPPSFFTAGDIIGLTDVKAGYGWITSSSNALVIVINVAKPILGVTSLTINSMSGTIRCGQGGNLQYNSGGTYTAISNIAIPYDGDPTIDILGSQITITLTCSSKWGRSSANVTNNSTVIVQFTALSLELA